MNRYESSPVRKLFISQLKKLKEDNPHIIAGVSGGPDSMAMLYCLHKEGVQTTAVHINYGLRGTDSDKDQALAEEISSLWGIDCVTLNLSDMPHQSGNFQNRAREERYRIFEELMHELGGTVIATAHHQNDQIETIFQKILRGSGMTAWKGMEALEGLYFRPLIKVSRDNILEFVSDFNIPYRIDRTNEESTYARNFIRNNWFPQLEDLFPGWQENVLSLQDRAREYETLLKEKAEHIREDDLAFSRERFLSSDPILQPAIVKYLYEKRFADHSLSKNVLLKMKDLSELQTGSEITLTSETSLLRDRNFFRFVEHHEEDRSEIKILERKEILIEDKIIIGELLVSITEFDPRNNKENLQADLTEVCFPITIRRWRDGDRFQPFGMKGTQLVSDHLTNRKISSGKKREAKIIESFDGKVVAVIFPEVKPGGQPGTLSDDVRCSDKTKQTLTIEIKN